MKPPSNRECGQTCDLELQSAVVVAHNRLWAVVEARGGPRAIGSLQLIGELPITCLRPCGRPKLNAPSSRQPPHTWCRISNRGSIRGDRITSWRIRLIGKTNRRSRYSIANYFGNFHKRGSYRFAGEYVFEPRLNPGLASHLARVQPGSKQNLILVYGRPHSARNAFELVGGPGCRKLTPSARAQLGSRVGR